MSKETLHKVSSRESPINLESGFMLEITSSKGGVGLYLKKGDPIDLVIEHLRQLADRLERDVIAREQS